VPVPTEYFIFYTSGIRNVKSYFYFLVRCIIVCIVALDCPQENNSLAFVFRKRKHLKNSHNPWDVIPLLAFAFPWALSLSLSLSLWENIRSVCCNSRQRSLLNFSTRSETGFIHLRNFVFHHYIYTLSLSPFQNRIMLIAYEHINESLCVWCDVSGRGRRITSPHIEILF